MYYYSFNELYKLIKLYNKKYNTNIDVNEILGSRIIHPYTKQDIHKLMNDNPPKVLYEDENYYGIYKPPYWIVNVGSKERRHDDVKYNMNRNLLQVWLYKNLDYPLREEYNLGYVTSI